MTTPGGPDDGRGQVDPARRAEVQRVTEQVYGRILSNGFVVIGTTDLGDAPFIYTVGMTEHGLPELVVTGVSQEDGGRLLIELANRQRRGGAFTDGQITEALGEQWRFDERPTLWGLGFVETIYSDNDPHPPTALSVVHLSGGA